MTAEAVEADLARRGALVPLRRAPRDPGVRATGGRGRARPGHRPLPRKRARRIRPTPSGRSAPPDAVPDLLGVEGGHRLRGAQADRARPGRSRRRRCASTSPATTVTARRGSRSAMCSPTARGCPTSRARPWTSTGWATATSWSSSSCDARPFAKPGRYLAYHAVSGGFILGEVVHQVTGKDIRQVLAEEFLEPLGFRWTSYGVAEEDLDEVAIDYSTGARLLPPLSNLMPGRWGPLPMTSSTSRTTRASGPGSCPPATSISTANEFSLFYEMLRRGGELDGTRVIEADTIRTALTEQSHLDIDFTLGFPTRFGYGADARRAAAQPLRAGHPACVRAPGLHEHLGLGGSRARPGRRRHDQRQADALPRGRPLPRPDAADHQRGAEGARPRDRAR